LHPLLARIQIGGFVQPIQSYGLCVVLAATVGVLVTSARAPQHGLTRFDGMAVALLGVGGGVVGAALLYFIVHAREFFAEPELFLHPGLVFYGGLGGGAVTIWLYCRKFGVSMARAGDAGTVGLALGHAIGRVGCLLAGCCYGRACAADFPLGVTLHGALRHPVQLYESAGLVALAGLLALVSPRLRERPGLLSAAYLGGYALLRLSTESFRGDDVERGFVGPLSTSQAIAVAMLLASLVLFYYAKLRAEGVR
jgi:phosphatidylglycerol---prolipoprotein diacylglyceryl transferase